MARFRGSKTRVALHGTYMIVSYTWTITSLKDFAHGVGAGRLVFTQRSSGAGHWLCHACDACRKWLVNETGDVA